MKPFEKYLITFFYYLPMTNIKLTTNVVGWFNDISNTINYENNYSFLGLGEIKENQIISYNKIN